MASRSLRFIGLTFDHTRYSQKTVILCISIGSGQSCPNISVAGASIRGNSWSAVKGERIELGLGQGEEFA